MAYPVITLLSAFSLLLAASDWRVQEKEEIKQTLRFSDPAKTRQVIVDNINGAITVAGYAGSEVQLVAIKTLRARSPERLAEAREKIRLEISERDNVIELYVDSPCRRRDDDRNYRGSDYYGFEVQFDFTLKVPWQTDLRLKTINDGDIDVENVAGEFDIDNINGSVEMLEVAGGGRAYALNGELAVRFKKNPEIDSYFGSLNGDVKVELLENLSADVRLKTFNGEVYTDFRVTSLPARARAQEKSGGRYVYRSDSAFGVRIGSGGPELEFDAFNGDIHIVKRPN
ncbi:MAG: hypothetical protein ACREOO_23090 [bacterium]